MQAKKHIIFHLVQLPSPSGSPLKTLQSLQKMLKNFTPKKGEWVVLPEMWPASFNPREAEKQIMENAFCFHWLKSLAKKHRCFVAGSMLEMPKKKAYNSAFVIDERGHLISRYRKIHLFRLTKEHLKYQRGKTIRVLPMPWGKIGLAICFDLRFPELFLKMIKKEVQVVIVPSAWPLERLDHFLTLMQARAIENQCFFVGTNKCGTDPEGVVYGGHSVVFGPWGEKLGELGNKKGILSVRVRLGRVEEIRSRYPFLKSRVLS